MSEELESRDMDGLVDIQEDGLQDNETEIFSKIVNPSSKTSYRTITVWDPKKRKYVKKAKQFGLPEINTPDLTTGILVGKKSEFSFAWHTILLINQLSFLQMESEGLDGSDKLELGNLIQFHYNNLTTNLNLSKSVEGALQKALTTKELKQIQEHRVTNSDGRSLGAQNLGELLRGSFRK